MMPLFPFLLGAAATALLTTDSGRKLADSIGEIVANTARQKYEEAMSSIKTVEGVANKSEDKEHGDERNAE